jgi:hypothetical protein
LGLVWFYNGVFSTRKLKGNKCFLNIHDTKTMPMVKTVLVDTHILANAE